MRTTVAEIASHRCARTGEKHVGRVRVPASWVSSRASMRSIIQDQLTGPCVAAQRLMLAPSKKRPMLASDALGRSFDVDMPMPKHVA